MMFYVGQKIVFIGNGKFVDTLKVYPFLKVPQKDQIYTIRELTYVSNIPGMRLCEIHNSRCIFAEGFIEICFLRCEFRPLCEKKTDISIFQKMLLNEHVMKERAVGDDLKYGCLKREIIGGAL